MAYNQNIPQPADQLKNSQPQILANFQEINTALNVNHVGFNVADEGKHKFIQFPQQVADPATNPTEYAQYSKAGLFSNATEVVFRTPSSASIVNITEAKFNLADGWYQLPSGLIVKWFFVAIPNSPGVTNLTYDFVWPIASSIPFGVAPIFTSFCFFGATGQIIRLIPSVDITQSTATHFYGRLDAPTSAPINVTPFNIMVTSYGI